MVELVRVQLDDVHSFLGYRLQKSRHHQSHPVYYLEQKHFMSKSGTAAADKAAAWDRKPSVQGLRSCFS